jgi:hypothetical protein
MERPIEPDIKALYIQNFEYICLYIPGRAMSSIIHVFGYGSTKKRLKVLRCNGKTEELAQRTIQQYITPRTTYTVRKVGPMVRDSVHAVYRAVFWEGYENPTFESPGFKV